MGAKTKMKTCVCVYMRNDQPFGFCVSCMLRPAQTSEFSLSLYWEGLFSEKKRGKEFLFNYIKAKRKSRGGKDIW